MSTFTTQVSIDSISDFGKAELTKAIANARSKNKLNNEFVGYDILHSHTQNRTFVELVFMGNTNQQNSFFVTFGEDHRDVDEETLFGKYYVVSGFSEEHVIGKVKALRKESYCAIYPISRLQDMVEKYEITEVPTDHIFNI